MVAAGTGGLADSIVGAVTIFFVSILTNRKFFMHFYEEAAYSWVVEDSGHFWEGLHIDQTIHKLFLQPFESDMKDNTSVIFRKALLQNDLNEVMGISDYYVVTNYGGLMDLYRNPRHKNDLSNIVHESLAFHCAMQILFRPNEHVLELIYKAYEIALRSSTTIGIHVRTGDDAFLQASSKNSTPILPLWIHFFDCADSLERQLSGLKIIKWILITDSSQLRQEASATYGSKIVTDEKADIRHSANDRNRENSSWGLKIAFGEHYVLSRTTYQILSKNSGFGRTAALNSIQTNKIFFPPACNLDDAVTLSDLSKIPPYV